jgi:hypothetical protein
MLYIGYLVDATILNYMLYIGYPVDTTILNYMLYIGYLQGNQYTTYSFV